ncbi:MAG: RsmB/NOP family class I SAM-dependent RNA methyltransferase [Lachnospiraceae bacterium]|nr:RsmB/NOP family class I SAM-dependent RNA methyltransferase [Lachnospiraceae bacterium]
MLPVEFENRMKGMLGDEYEAFSETFQGGKYQALRLNSLKKNKDGKTAAEVLRTSAFCGDEVSWAQNGYYYDTDVTPGKHPYHEAGLYYIQEPSAMAPVGLLDVRPEEFVLDLCAAPGGKSTQIAALLKGKGLLISNEINPQRAKILSENMERMGIRNAYVTNESPDKLSKVFPSYFHKILVDAPCSGEGMFRKNEEAVTEWSLENVELCASRQDMILDEAAKMLLPGGRIVYSTCTFAPAENEGSISRFLNRHPEFRIVPIDGKALGIEGECGGVPEYVEGAAPGIEGTLRLWPHKIKGEGHFAAVLQKEGETPDGYIPCAANGFLTGVREKDIASYREFEKEFLNVKLEGVFVKFGENIYLAPENAPDIKGLKVLRCGLQLGSEKKNRFEPSHALALSLSPFEAKYFCDLKSDDGSAGSFQNGLTFNHDGEKGWYLIGVDGFSTGWGKLAGGIMKNHYPKGLRKAYF